MRFLDKRHLLAKLLEMGGDLTNLRLSLEDKFGWELGKGLVLANISHTEKLAVDHGIIS